MNNSELTGVSRLIGNVAILVAGFFLFLGGVIAVGIVFAAAIVTVLLRRLKPGRPALTAGG